MELESFNTDAEFLWIGDQVVNVCGMEKLFGGNAAAQKTGTAEVFIFFDNSCFQSNLCGTDGSDITSGSRADHGDIKLFRHFPPRGHPGACDNLLILSRLID